MFPIRTSSAIPLRLSSLPSARITSPLTRRAITATPSLRSPVTTRVLPLPLVQNPSYFTSKRAFTSSPINMAGGNVVEITSKEDFQEKVVNTTEPVLVDFFATWCGPCKAISPAIEKFSTAHTNVKFYQVDVDKLSEVAAENGISAMPTFLFFKDGKKLEEATVRGANPPAIKASLDKLLA